MSIGRLLSVAASMRTIAHPPLPALLDKDFQPWQEQCKFCGVLAESVCDHPPTAYCEGART